MQATATTLDTEPESTPVNSRNKVVVASLIGTAIEFFDFYIYATAAVIVFPHIFFPQGDPTAATLQSLANFRYRLRRTPDWLCAVWALWRPHWP
jgi:hypothetical protein